jgi:hypothetical protein
MRIMTGKRGKVKAEADLEGPDANICGSMEIVDNNLTGRMRAVMFHAGENMKVELKREDVMELYNFIMRLEKEYEQK